VEDGTQTTLIIPLIYADEIRVHQRSFLRCQRAIFSTDRYRNPLTFVIDHFQHPFVNSLICHSQNTNYPTTAHFDYRSVQVAGSDFKNFLNYQINQIVFSL